MNICRFLFRKFCNFIWGLPGLILLLAFFLLLNGYVQSIPDDPFHAEPQFIVLPITLTAYSPEPEQTDANPYETASTLIMTRPDLQRQLFAAASRDLLDKFTPGAPLKYGDKIYLEVTIIDTMHSRWTNRIDLFCRNQQIAEYIGCQPNRNIIILKE